MAERRMFAKTIIDSDAFIDMPLSTQALYFHLSMRGDDDGFINNPKKIMRMIGASEDDLKVLISKRFIIPFESGIVVIKHWKIHNYIRGDRKKDTNYSKEMALLTEKENGTYTLKTEDMLLEDEEKETARQKAYRESDLPYSFEYKIRHAFYGEICPVCGCKMSGSVDECGIGSNMHKPSIQHNIPISKGGKHELGNISVICHQCNVSLRDTETDKLNADEVIKKWDEICMTDNRLTSDSQATDNCQHRLGQGRLSQVNLGEIKVVEVSGNGNQNSDNNNPKTVENSVDNVENSKFELMGGELGMGVVLLTETQRDSLLDLLGLPGFNHYVKKLATFIISKEATVSNHYQTILKWAKEDRKL